MVPPCAHTIVKGPNPNPCPLAAAQTKRACRLLWMDVGGCPKCKCWASHHPWRLRSPAIHVWARRAAVAVNAPQCSARPGRATCAMACIACGVRDRSLKKSMPMAPNKTGVCMAAIIQAAASIPMRWSVSRERAICNAPTALGPPMVVGAMAAATCQGSALPPASRSCVHAAYCPSSTNTEPKA